MTTTALPAAGLTLGQLAVLRRIPRGRAAALVAPFLIAGVVVELEDGRLVVADPLVLEAFEEWEVGA